MGPLSRDPRFAHLTYGMQQQMPMLRPGSIYTPTLPYQQSAGAQIGQAFAEFMGGYAQQEQASKAQAAQEAMRDLEMMSLGIPIDHKKTVQKMKKAGIDINTEAPAPQVKANATPGAGFQMPNPMAAQQGPPPTMQAGGQGGAPPVQVPMNMPMQQATPPMQMPAYTPTPEQTAAAQPLPPQSRWASMMQRLGMQPPRVNPNSAPVLALENMQQQMQQQRAQQQQLSNLTSSNQLDQQMLLRAILHPNPATQEKALEMAYTTGLAKRSPFEEQYNLSGAQAINMPREKFGAMMLASAMGTQKMQAQVIDMAMKLSPRFGDDMEKSRQYAIDILTTGKSQLHPQMTFDERLKLSETANKFQELYPTIPYNFAQTMAMNNVVGDKKVTEAIQKVLSTKDEKTGWFLFPTKGQLDNYYKQANLTLEQNAALRGWKQLGLTAQAQQNEMQRHFENAQLSLFSQLRGEKNQGMDMAMKMYYAPGAKDEQKRNAMKLAADSMNKMPPFEFNITGANGKEFKYKFDPSKVSAEATSEWLMPFWDDPDGYYLKIVKDVQATGKPPDTGNSELNKFFNKLMESDVFKPTQPGGMIGPIGTPSGFALPSSMGQPAYPNQYELPANPIRQGGVQQFPRGGGGY